MVVLYLDPGAGTMVVQMLVAAGIAVPFFLRDKIMGLVGKLRRRNGPGPEEHSSSTN